MGLLSVGSKEFLQARCLSAVCGLSTVVSFDEEKPPCRAMQGEVGKHSGESEAYTNLAGAGRQASRSGREASRRGARYRGEHGRAPGLAADCSLRNTVGGFWHATQRLSSKADWANEQWRTSSQADLCQAAHG